MGERKALIIASDHYEQEDLPDLVSPAADAEALSKVLGDPLIGGFNVRVAQNELSHQVAGRIEDMLADCSKDDLLLVHFSCHGLKKPSGELYFAAPNTRPKRLDSTAVSAEFLQRCLRDSPARQVVLFLDCCYSGAFPSGVIGRGIEINALDSFPVHRLGRGRSRAVITSASSAQLALEPEAGRCDGPPRPSFFTAAVVEGLATGAADRDEDGWITVNELYDYVFEKVQELAPGQTPRRQVDMDADFYLARSRRRRIRQAPLPADLQAAVTDPNLYTRRGAISELSTRLRSENLSAALGAYEALTEVVRTDIEYLASFASTALLDAAIRPSQKEVHLGRVTRDDRPPRHTIRLLGPPIARECVLLPSAEWLRAERQADVLDITVDTARSGVLRGRIELKGPTGGAVIEVDVEVVDPPPEPQPDGVESGSLPPSGESSLSDQPDGLLSGILRDRTGGGPNGRARRGADVETETTLSFSDAIDGATITLRLTGKGLCPVCRGIGAKAGTVPLACPDCHGSGQSTSSRIVSARIPAGVADNQRIRIPGRGLPGEHGGKDGDLYVRIHVTAHPVFGRNGDDLTVTVPIAAAEAKAGVDIKVPTHRGPAITIRLTPGMSNGTVLRVPGRGVRKRDGTLGELRVTLEVVGPQKPGEEVKTSQDHPHAAEGSAEAKRAALITEARS